MQTKKLPEREQEEVEERDIELENVVGNLMIAQYQVDRLRSSFCDKPTYHLWNGVWSRSKYFHL